MACKDNESFRQKSVAICGLEKKKSPLKILGNKIVLKLKC